ncbi:hypothetical protein CICLE_v10028422mg [Citrus x clementina]|uniref:Glycosyltransferase n=1 Tax=Citrus clementina TaxID=85681 RepID=V4SMA3_CITCL|nr:UDP-glucose iridoid glucosyltransferase [Citrus x clementina]ESR38176.1 hypothetical protein CICLE_v10028422mg [Citrus x clementina]
MEEQGQRRRRVVLVPSPHQGHINPTLQLGTILHSKGFSITVVHTQFNSPNPSNHPEFEFQSIPDGLMDVNISARNLVDSILLLNENCREPFRNWLVQMIKEQQPGDEIVCIIYDEVMYFAEASASQLNVQSIILRTSGAVTVVARLVLFQLKEEGYNPLKDPNKLQDPVPRLHPLRVKDLPIFPSEITESYVQLINNAYSARTSSAVISNTIYCLEKSVLSQLQQYFQVPNFPIGPLHKFAPSSNGSLLKEDTSCISWLNNQSPKSVIYVSLGSVASMDKKELEEMAWGLVNSKQPFLWVIRPRTNNAPEGIELLPKVLAEDVQENGYIVKWAPQKEVLSHVAVGGFWSHCGWNSTLESVCEGVPMICMPFFEDQKVNARYLSHVWGVGLELEHELERGAVEKAVRKLMVDKEGEFLRQRAAQLKEEVELSTRKGGFSYNSLNELLDLINKF